jgi:RNA polymerase sigma factor (sigma-70 family)
MTYKLDLVSLIASSKNRISRIVAKIVPSADVDDILQETYLRVHTAVLDKEINEPIAFITQIAKNLALDHIKSAEFKKLQFVDREAIEGLINQENSVDSTLTAIISQQDLMQFLSAVQTLPAKCQEVYTLRKIYGYSQKEIAQRLGVTTSAIEKHIAYGTKKLFHLMPHDPERQPKLMTNKASHSPTKEGIL